MATSDSTSINQMRISPYLNSLTDEEIDNMFHNVLDYADSSRMISRFLRGLSLIDENYTLHQLMTTSVNDPAWGAHGQVANALKWGVLFGFAKQNNFNIVPIPEEIRGRNKSCRLVISEGNFIDITAVSSISMILEQTSQAHDQALEQGLEQEHVQGLEQALEVNHTYHNLQYVWLIWLTVLTIIVIYNDNVVVEWLMPYVKLSYKLLTRHTTWFYDLVMYYIVLFMMGFKTLVVTTLKYSIDSLDSLNSK